MSDLFDAWARIAAGDSGSKDDRGNPIAATDRQRDEAKAKLRKAVGTVKMVLAIRAARVEFQKQLPK